MNADTSGIAKLIVARVRGDAVRMKAIPKTAKNAAGMESRLAKLGWRRSHAARADCEHLRAACGPTPSSGGTSACASASRSHVRRPASTRRPCSPAPLLPCSDSVDDEVLRDRQAHAERIEAAEADPRVLEQITAIKIGRLPGWSNQKAVLARQRARQLVSKVKPLGRSLQHAAAINAFGLPEIALAGYSNSGKSSLLNALTGLPAQRGPASVDARAGWTESLFGFEATVGGTTLALVDTPGYGVAVQSGWTRARWERALVGYLESSAHLRCVFVLVDCTRGLCELDWTLIRRAERRSVRCQLVLTKADLLPAQLLARSHAVVAADLREGSRGVRHPMPAMVSANFAQGVRQLWALARHHALTAGSPAGGAAGAGAQPSAPAEEVGGAHPPAGS